MSEFKLKFQMEETDEGEPSGTRLKVVGVGGCGCNIVDDMCLTGVKGAEFISVNTDVQSLTSKNADDKIQIGKRLTGGRGAGQMPDRGEKAAEEDRELLEKKLRDTDMLFIAAGMGGGTGSGAAPVIADIARSLDILTVGVVITPMKFEMEKSEKKRIVEDAVEKMRDKVNALIVISNQMIFERCDRQIKFSEAYREVNRVIANIIRGVIYVITETGTQNIDFEDVKTTLKQKGSAYIGIGRASGADRAEKAFMKALNNPFMGDVTLSGAKNVLVNFAGEVLLNEVAYIEQLKKETGELASAKFGVVEDASFGDEIEVVVMVSGITERESEAPRKAEAETKNLRMSQLTRRMAENDYNDIDIPAYERFKTAGDDKGKQYN